jgi:WD40 repeat protein
MKQRLNLLVALLGALLLGATIVIGLQNPPPTEVRRPVPTPTAPNILPATPVPFITSTPSGMMDLPRDRRGMLLVTGSNGTLHLISGNGAQSWIVDLKQPLASAAWSPDGRHIVVATSSGNALVTHPERQDRQALLAPSQRLASDTLIWTNPLTVALTVEHDHMQPNVALWSYRNRQLELLGPGSAPAVARSGAVAWITPNGRAIMVKREAAAPELLVTLPDLDSRLADRQPSARDKMHQSHSAALAWSVDETRLAFTVSTPREGASFDSTIAVTTLDGQIQQWSLAPDTSVYQLGWLVDGRLLFTSDEGLSLIDPASRLITRLLPQYPDIRSFALHPDGSRVIVSMPAGLYQLSTVGLEWPRIEARPFGPRGAGYERLDWCCTMNPRPGTEP